MFDDLVNFHAKNYFANEDFVGVKVVLAPGGDWDASEEVDVVSVADQLLGSNENRGDGVRLERENGRTIRESIIVEFLGTANIQRIQSPRRPDQIRWEGKIWTATRTIAFDRAMKAVQFVRIRDVLTKGQSKRG